MGRPVSTGGSDVLGDDAKYNPLKAATYADPSVSNEQTRNIALTAVVAGGESSNLMMEVSDMRYPSAIKSVNLSRMEMIILLLKWYQS